MQVVIGPSEPKRCGEQSVESEQSGKQQAEDAIAHALIPIRVQLHYLQRDHILRKHPFLDDQR